MKPVTFFDIEVEPRKGRILDLGCIRSNGDTFHSNSIPGFVGFLRGSEYICGHNIFRHDLKYIGNYINDAGLKNLYHIDTLYLSPLMFPKRPYHALIKDDKLQTDDVNNPLNDSIKAKDLFFDEVSAFHRIDDDLKCIYYHLLGDKREFSAFFKYLDYEPSKQVIELDLLIRNRFYSKICTQSNLSQLISEHPIELAYCLALINTNSKYSITPPWVLKTYPDVERIMFLLRNSPCLKGCVYCDEALDVHKGLRRFFGFDSYRAYAGEPLQERAVRAAVKNKSLIAVFPTGGGKSITFQVPALMSGINSKGLTVVISPLQSLMKDQVDNLEKAGITDAVTVNGLLDPIERANSFERVENGSASILYLSPESLRSKTVERILTGRNVVRFVIDEAHCFSSWGQDFRVDYLYIGDFIKSLQERKNLTESIPVSCFTATAKQKVIEDIRAYFREKLSIEMDLFTSNASRSNLHYRVFQKSDEEEKYSMVRDLLAENDCPTIIYVSTTKKAYILASRLTEDGYLSKPYHGQMDKQEKSENQDAFMRGEVRIMVATSAFGMGVDKKDVGMVIHYEISNSLENYVQEAGRAGRDESISADCFVLYNEDDLDKHFSMLNRSKLQINEIQQIWRAIKETTRFRSTVSQSALEIARKAGWDENIDDLDTKVKTAITALEDAGYIKRRHNSPRVFADSILSRNAQEAIEKINKSTRFDDEQRVNATRVIKSLIGSKSRQRGKGDEAESRVDYMSDRLGIPKAKVIEAVNLLREERILSDAKDLIAYIRKKENKNRSLNLLNTYRQLEAFLLTIVQNEEITINLKEVNELAEENGCSDVSTNKIKTILNYWSVQNWIKRQYTDSHNHIAILSLFDTKELEDKLTKRYEMAKFILEYLFERSGDASAQIAAVHGQTQGAQGDAAAQSEETQVEFSVLELKEEFEHRLTLFSTTAMQKEVEEALFYLSRIEAMKIEGGFLVVYNALTIERLEHDNRIKYKQDDYQKLKQYYDNKIQQIHIVGEYARKMINDYKEALRFVDDYFRLNYAVFLTKYFKGARQGEITRNITPAKFKQLFGELSAAQLNIIKDKDSKHIVVAAGPGSGKTRILVHKLASLLLMEDVKSEQMLMVTFSRSAVTEFKKRLLKLIGNAAHYVEIKTFHSYCFDLMGRVGTLEKSTDIIREAIKRINSGDVEPGRITKTVLVIDEAQDMDENEFALVSTLMEHNEEMRVIAVGDDDQNIYEFRGSSSKYMTNLIYEKKAVKYELVQNYRSKSNLVDFSNQFSFKIPNRLKTMPIVAEQKDNGTIKVTKHRSSNLITPLIDNLLLEDISGSTCILTKTNDEAMQITGLLVKKGLPAKLIQSNDGFNLYNLLEIRFILNQFSNSEKSPVISDEEWKAAKKGLMKYFNKSPNLELCINIVKDFEAANPKIKYRSDFDVFVRESKMEDFLSDSIETIYVSTIHKAKGREFDNVFMLLEDFNPQTAENLRLLYVAITRAKRNLYIHYNGSYFEGLKAGDLSYMYDLASYSAPGNLAIQLSYRDVWLSFFQSKQKEISGLYCGVDLIADTDCCRDSKGQIVVRYSKQFMTKVEQVKQNGYVPKSAKVRFVVFWKGEDSEIEIKVILPELCFEKNQTSNYKLQEKSNS